MIFNTTTDKLSLITSEACDVDVVVTFVDRVTSTGAIGAADRQLTNPTTATTTDILAVPAADTERKIAALSIRNAHATTSVDVTVQFNANGTLYEIHAARLYAGDKLEWAEHTGFVLTRAKPKIFGRRLISDDVSQNGTTQARVAALSVSRQQPPGQLLQHFGFFGAILYTSVAQTTGTAIGPYSTDGYSYGNYGAILYVTPSVTNASMAGGLGSLDGSLFIPIASPVSEGVGLFLVAGGHSTNPGTGEVVHQTVIVVQSEIAGSAVKVKSGGHFDVFEITG